MQDNIQKASRVMERTQSQVRYNEMRNERLSDSFYLSWMLLYFHPLPRVLSDTFIRPIRYRESGLEWKKETQLNGKKKRMWHTMQITSL